MIFHHKRNVGFTFCILLIANCAQAGMEKFAFPMKYENLEISAAGGAGWYDASNGNTIISSFETDSAHVHHISTNGAWKLGIGYYLFEDKLQQQRYLNHLLFEMNVATTSTTLTGDVWQYGIPTLNNYTFRAPVKTTRLMFDLKPTLFTWQKISPYAILGLGAAWNTVSYKETAIDADIDPASAMSLSNHTNAQLAWEVGAGLKVALSEKLSATAEYIYTSLGNGSPSGRPANGVNLSEAPYFSFQTQSLFLGLSLTL
jgi:opacity protein-like surface antigen